MFPEAWASVNRSQVWASVEDLNEASFSWVLKGLGFITYLNSLGF